MEELGFIIREVGVIFNPQISKSGTKNLNKILYYLMFFIVREAVAISFFYVTGKLNFYAENSKEHF